MARERYIIKECEQCGQMFETSRYDSKFCKPSCRLTAHRTNKKIASAESVVKNAISDYLKLFQSDETYQAEIDRLMSYLRANSIG